MQRKSQKTRFPLQSNPGLTRPPPPPPRWRCASPQLLWQWPLRSPPRPPTTGLTSAPRTCRLAQSSFQCCHCTSAQRSGLIPSPRSPIPLLADWVWCGRRSAVSRLGTRDIGTLVSPRSGGRNGEMPFPNLTPRAVSTESFPACNQPFFCWLETEIELSHGFKQDRKLFPSKLCSVLCHWSGTHLSGGALGHREMALETACKQRFETMEETAVHAYI